ncbi:hypothetical protein ACLHDG_01820 [Sulfurovum sp. CS9]|uniref:hypothetical protein n=1 Tax=Sulfurovum sp. CS9 TaxID=3391146 RepID=UPI0039EB1C17
MYTLANLLEEYKAEIVKRIKKMRTDEEVQDFFESGEANRLYHRMRLERFPMDSINKSK